MRMGISALPPKETPAEEAPQEVNLLDLENDDDEKPAQVEADSEVHEENHPVRIEPGEGEGDESVYIKDNIVMRRIQIEGEDEEYLMDPEGNIYDMEGNFIGTANTNELEGEETTEDQAV